MTRSERAYRWLLRAYPKATRERCGDDMVQLFGDRLRDAQSGREVAGIWTQVLADVAKTAPRERLVARRVRQVVEGPALEPERVPMKREAALASIPLVIWLLLAIWRPALLGAMLVNPPGFLGAGFGMAILFLFAILASVAILAVRRNTELNDPWHQAIALLIVLVPVPALMLVGGSLTAAMYAWIATTMVLLARFRRLMLALTIPFFVWLVIGPAVMGIVVPIMSGLGAADI